MREEPTTHFDHLLDPSARKFCGIDFACLKQNNFVYVVSIESIQFFQLVCFAFYSDLETSLGDMQVGKDEFLASV